MARGEPLIRQWNLLKALQSVYYGLSADELAKRLECSKRQILRDLNMLQQVGFPISFQQRDFGKRFWKLTAHFIESDKMVFSLTELISLYLSQKLLSPLAQTPFGQGIHTLMEKIKALISPKALRYFEHLDQTFLVKTASASSPLDGKIVQLLAQAVEHQRAVQLTYRSLNAEQPYQTLYAPYGLIFFDNDLYCVGWMQRHNEIRTVKISRILSAQPTEHRFEKPDDFSIQSYIKDSLGIFSEGTKGRTYRIELTGWAAVHARETKRHPSQRIIADKGNTLQIEMTLSSDAELKRWLFSFGPCAKALGPADFVRQIATEIRQMHLLYSEKCKKTAF